MFWLIFMLAFVYIPAVGTFVACGEGYRIRAGIAGFALTTLWLWGLLALAT